MEPELGAEPSLVLTPEGDCGDPDPEAANDTMRAVLKTFGPALAKMPRKQRRKVAADIAARMKKLPGRRRIDAYAALDSFRKQPANPADLGKRIMEKHNVNYRK